MTRICVISRLHTSLCTARARLVSGELAWEPVPLGQHYHIDRVACLAHVLYPICAFPTDIHGVHCTVLTRGGATQALHDYHEGTITRALLIDTLAACIELADEYLVYLVQQALAT